VRFFVRRFNQGIFYLFFPVVIQYAGLVSVAGSDEININMVRLRPSFGTSSLLFLLVF
jgi:hypothetical protein